MNDDYLDAFVRECEEQLTALNTSLLAIEDDPSAGDAVDRIFRTAHTMKGNFAAMGFSDGADLAHAMEDVLEELRAGRLEATPAVVDHLFSGVDAIESMVAEIEEAGEPSTDPATVIEALRTTIEERGGVSPDADAGTDRDAGNTSIEPLLRSVAPDEVDAPVYAIDVGLAESDMRGVDGMLVLKAVGDAFELLGCQPERAVIEDGEYGDGFALLVGAAARADVEGFVRDLGQVESAVVTDVSGRLDGGGSTQSSDGAGTARSAPDEIKSVRVDVGQLDELYSSVQQLLKCRISLSRAVENDDMAATADAADALEKITAGLQDTVMDMRLLPLRKVVDTFPRLVRDLARAEDKAVDFEMVGTDVELDRSILDEVGDPLMHILRNAVDHGIEPPEVREAAGKPREGHVELVATRERDHVEVQVSDDGAGLDPAAIREAAAERGVRPPNELETMSDEAVLDLVFHPGFSTNDEVTDVSGRGVGMDVVQRTVSRLDGSVAIQSEPGEGTAVTLRLPVSLAIARILFVRVGERTFGLPSDAIDEITRVEGVATVNGRPVVDHHDAVYPIVDLRERLTDRGPASEGVGRLLRIRGTERRVALRCDDVDRLEEVVVKPLDGVLADVPGVSGTAIVGDGEVVPIIDVATV